MVAEGRRKVVITQYPYSVVTAGKDLFLSLIFGKGYLCTETERDFIWTIVFV